MKKDLRQKGFTLIELAIVLVIIGIIMGAVIKGQDLLESAKAKKLTSTVNAWTTIVWMYMDRIGTLPGDAGGDGIMGNAAAEITTGGSAIGVLATAGTMANVPANPVSIGGQSFWIYFGFDTPAAGNKNVMVICPAVACGTAFTADSIRIIQSLDTSVDGAANAGLGQFRGATGATLAGAGTVNGRAAAAVTAVAGVNETTTGLATAWATTQTAAVWLFDRPY